MKIKRFKDLKINEAVSEDNKTYLSVKEMKEFIISLPEEFDSYSVVVRDWGILTEADEYTYALDKPIMALNIDEENKEFTLLDSESLKKYDEINKE